ncbi:MAG: ATP-dependent Clp protease proteolytic subunit [Psychrobacillus sp.]
MMGTPEMINRKIVISQPITDRLAGDVIDHIMAINDFDQQMSVISTYQREPIEMFINSGGGSATAGFAIIGAMEMSETPIVTYGIGIVASMALGIFVTGDVRIANRFCRFMYHSVAYGEEGFIQDHIDGLKEVGIVQDMYNSLFLDRTKFTPEMMREITEKKQNFFFSGKKAVKFGIADDVMKKPEKSFDMVTEEEYKSLMEELEKQTK